MQTKTLLHDGLVCKAPENLLVFVLLASVAC